MSDKKETASLVDWEAKADLLNEVLDLQIKVFGEKEIPILSRLIDQHKIQKMLDVGCHNGGYTKELALRHPHTQFLGVDIDVTKIKEAIEQNSLSNLQFQVCDITTCGQELFQGVDGIMARYTIQHLDIESVLKRIKKFAQKNLKMFFVEAYHPFSFEWPQKALYEEYMKQFAVFISRHNSNYEAAQKIPGIANDLGYKNCQTHLAFCGLWQNSRMDFINVLVKIGYLIHMYCPDLFQPEFMKQFEDYLTGLTPDQQVYNPVAVIEISH